MNLWYDVVGDSDASGAVHVIGVLELKVSSTSGYLLIMVLIVIVVLLQQPDDDMLIDGVVILDVVIINDIVDY